MSRLTYVSLFSGICAATAAWKPLGMEPLAFAEIEPFPAELLRQRHPGVPNLGDVSRVDWTPYRGKADVVVGGSPCQAFSVAGLRKSLEDPRGNLTLEYTAIDLAQHLKNCAAIASEDDNADCDCGYKPKPAKDRPRYKALGNAMAVPVMEWIGRRIIAAEGGISR